MDRVFSGALLADTIKIEAIRRNLTLGQAFSQMRRQDNGKPVQPNQLARLRSGQALPRMDILMGYLYWLGRYDLEEFMVFPGTLRREPDGSVTIKRVKPREGEPERFVLSHT